jgi:hypothetical protein
LIAPWSIWLALAVSLLFLGGRCNCLNQPDGWLVVGSATGSPTEE